MENRPEQQPGFYMIDARDVVINSLADLLVLREQLFEEARDLPDNYIPFFRINSEAP